MKNMILLMITLLASMYALLFVLAMDSLSINQLVIGGIIAVICALWDYAFIKINL